MNDEGPGLAEVRNRFLDAEEELRRIAVSIKAFDSASSLLSGSGAAVQEAAQRVSALAEILQGLAVSMREATDVVQKTDPATVVRLLRENEVRTKAAETALQEQKKRLEAIEEAGSEQLRATQKESSAIRERIEVLQRDVKVTNESIRRVRIVSRNNLILVVVSVLLAGATLTLVALMSLR